MTSTIPTIEQQAKYYDKWNQLCRTGGFFDMPPEQRRQTGKILELFCSLDLVSPTILELGCGTGWLLALLSQFGACTGIDLSHEAIRFAKQRGSNATLLAGDFLTTDLPKAHFDVCISVAVVAYFADQPAVFAKVASHLKPDGYILLTTNNKFVFDRRSDVPPTEEGQFRNWLTVSQVRALLAPHFDVLYLETIFPSGHCGVLRLVNSVKLNALLNLVFSKNTIKRVKERLGLGEGIVVLARRKPS